MRGAEARIEGDDQQFKGALNGIPRESVTDPEYLSMVGQYQVAKSRYQADQRKWAELLAWANGVKPDPVADDLYRLRSEGNALQVELRGVGDVLGRLPSTMAGIERRRRLEERIKAVRR